MNLIAVIVPELQMDFSIISSIGIILVFDKIDIMRLTARTHIAGHNMQIFACYPSNIHNSRIIAYAVILGFRFNNKIRFGQHIIPETEQIGSHVIIRFSFHIQIFIKLEPDPFANQSIRNGLKVSRENCRAVILNKINIAVIGLLYCPDCDI